MNYYHGYLLVGDMEAGKEKALKMASEVYGISSDLIFSHPDFYFFEGLSLSIGEARNIRDKASKKSFSGKGRVFIVNAKSFTREAGNALLKILEEPAGLNRFFLITSSADNIPETLRSRLVVSNFEREVILAEDKKKFIEKFLKLSLSGRIKLIGSFLNDKEKTGVFFDALEIFLRENLVSGFSLKTADSVEELMKCRSMLNQPASSVKMILEHLCLVL